MRKLIDLRKKKPSIKKKFSKIDLLYKLYNGRINLKNTKKLYERYAFSVDTYKDWERLLTFSELEVTAFIAGVDFKTLAKWRYEGWPNVCYKCKKKIDLRESKWWVIKRNGGNYKIYHVRCNIKVANSDKRIDLLRELYGGNITDKDAFELMHRLIDYLKIGEWWEVLGFSANEIKAHVSPGIPNLKTLAKWRYEGWPTKCHLCDVKLDTNKTSNWWVMKDKRNRPVLKHLNCKVNKK